MLFYRADHPAGGDRWAQKALEGAFDAALDLLDARYGGPGFTGVKSAVDGVGEAAAGVERAWGAEVGGELRSG